MNKVSLVIFDMDGLLIDSERGMWFINEKRMIEELGYKFDENLIISLMGSSMDNYKKTITSYYGNSFPIDLYYEKLFIYNEQIINEKKLKLMKGAKELLEFLKLNNIKMRVATSTPKEIAFKMLESVNILHYFETITTGDQVTNGKPSPEIYLKTIGNDNKDETLIFEDGHPGARAALSSGAHLMLVPDIARVTDEDKKEAYKVLKSLDDAINIIKSINDIK